MSRKTLIYGGLLAAGVYFLARHYFAQASFQKNFIAPLNSELNNPGTLGDNLSPLGGVPSAPVSNSP